MRPQTHSRTKFKDIWDYIIASRRILNYAAQVRESQADMNLLVFKTCLPYR